MTLCSAPRLRLRSSRYLLILRNASVHFDALLFAGDFSWSCQWLWFHFRNLLTPLFCSLSNFLFLDLSCCRPMRRWFKSCRISTDCSRRRLGSCLVAGSPMPAPWRCLQGFPRTLIFSSGTREVKVCRSHHTCDLFVSHNCKVVS